MSNDAVILTENYYSWQLLICRFTFWRCQRMSTEHVLYLGLNILICIPLCSDMESHLMWVICSSDCSCETVEPFLQHTVYITIFHDSDIINPTHAQLNKFECLHDHLNEVKPFSHPYQSQIIEHLWIRPEGPPF